MSFRLNVVLIKCRFDQVLFRSTVVRSIAVSITVISINCHFDQMLFRSSVVLIKVSFRSTVVRSSVVRSTVVAPHKVMAPAPQLAPTKQLINETLEVSLLRSDSKCRRYMSDLSESSQDILVLHRKAVGCYFGNLYFTFCFPVIEVEGRRHRFEFAELQFLFVKICQEG